MFKAVVVLGWGMLLGACGAATMVIKAPVEKECAGYGLKGCGELVDGVVRYVDGDKEGAVHKLKEAAAQNSPQQIRPFAEALKNVIPNEAGREIAEILSGEIAPEPVHPMAKTAQVPDDDEDATAEGTERPGAQPRLSAELLARTARLDNVELALVAPDDPARLVTETISPRADGPMQTICSLAGADGVCVRKESGGPLVLTDVVTPATCKSDLFVGAADYAGKFAWFVQTNAPGLQGTRLFVRSDQSLTFVARGVPANKELDARCVVTWSGFRPRMVPLNLATSHSE